MARFIIDDENISTDNISQLNTLRKKDKIYIVTNQNKKLSIPVLSWLLSHEVKINIVLLDASRKDYADKIITFLMGKLSRKKGKIYIVSNDKFYDDVIEFFNQKSKSGDKFAKLTFDFNRPLIAQFVAQNQKEIDRLMQSSLGLNDFYLKLISKFNSKEGLEIYNAIKDDARKFYATKLKKPLIQTEQKPEIKQLALKSEPQIEPEKQVQKDQIEPRILEAKPTNLQNEFKIDEKQKQEIRQILFSSKNLGDFHNGLMKKYGAQDAGVLYKMLKQKAKEALDKRVAGA